MSVVGLSFGSPTSGAGFNVSSTVESIVSNLRKVEEPWSSQLSDLQGQDTAISNLGTLLSTLSNDMSELTSFAGALLQKTGSSSNTSVLELTAASSTATAGTHSVIVKNLATTGAGNLTAIASASDTLSGSITIQVGSGAAQTITLDSSNNTLSGLAKAINSSGAGVTANIIKDSSGNSRLSLVSSASGANGGITVTSNSITDTTASKSLVYTNTVTPVDAMLTIDGMDLTSATNKVTDLIPGITFQLLGASPTLSSGSQEALSVVIANDNTAVESAVASFVTDYNALMSAVNTQETVNASGVTEPLFGSPTLSLLQQQLFSSINAYNPSGYLDYTSTSNETTFSGSFTIQVGAGSSSTIVLSSSASSIDDLASAINSASMGVTARVVTSGATEAIALYSDTTGSSGDIAITSHITAASSTALSFSSVSASGSVNAYALLSAISSSADTLSGSISIRVGSGLSQTIALSSSTDTLDELKTAINNGDYGVTASIVSGSNGGYQLRLDSNGSGSSGNLILTGALYDATSRSSSTLGYIHSSDINSLAALGVTMSSSADGTLSFDASSLDSILNSDFSGVSGFFQNANSWGKSFATMLANTGTNSSKGLMSLALSSNSSMEDSLQNQIDREESWISVQQAKLTAELTSANEILQSLPTQLDSINQLFNAITGNSSS